MIGGALLGAALLLLPAPNPARQRLAMLAGSRLAGATPVQPVRARHSARGWFAAAGVAATAGLTAGLLPAVIAMGALAGLAVCRRMLRAERDADLAREQLIDAVGAVVDEYRAGATAAGAYAAAAPAAGRFGGVLAEAGALAARGLAPERAWGAMPALAPLAIASALAGRTGASLAEVLAGVRSELRDERATRRAVAAAVAGPRGSALMLTGLPVLCVLMGSAIGAHPVTVLLRTPIGLVLLASGVLLDLGGLVWTLALTRQASP